MLTGSAWIFDCLTLTKGKADRVCQRGLWLKNAVYALCLHGRDRREEEEEEERASKKGKPWSLISSSNQWNGHPGWKMEWRERESCVMIQHPENGFLLSPLFQLRGEWGSWASKCGNDLKGYTHIYWWRRGKIDWDESNGRRLRIRNQRDCCQIPPASLRL